MDLNNSLITMEKWVQENPLDSVETFLYNTSSILSCSSETIYNITQIELIDYAKIMYGIMMPFLVFITLIANSLVIMVLSKPHMRSPTNLVLLWLAVADLLTLLAPAPWYFYMYTLSNHQILPHGSEFCYTYSVMVEHFPIIFHTTSIWLTILLAGQRYIYICHSSTAITTCTVTKVNKAIGTLFLLSLLLQFSRFFDTHYMNVTCQLDNSTLVPACSRDIAPWLADLSPDYYFLIYFGIRIIFVNVAPCIALVILNVLLFRALKIAQAKRTRLLMDNNRSGNRRRHDLTNSTTYMLIVVVSVFLLVEIPMAIVTIVHVLANLNILRLDPISYQYVAHYLKVTIIISNFIIMLSFPLNFAIYCGMSAQFRNTFKAMLSKYFCNQCAISADLVQQPETTVTLAIVGDSAPPPTGRNTPTQRNAVLFTSNGTIVTT